MFCKRKMCCRNFNQGDITFEELKQKVLQGAVLLDVRSIQEYKEGHLNGAICIPLYEINKIINEIPNKNQLIVTYCQYGGRSREAYTKLKKMGYTNIYNLFGGLDNI